MQLQVLHFRSYNLSMQYILVATENQYQQNIFPLWIVPWLLACQEQSPVLHQESPPRMIRLSCNSAMQSQLCVSTGCCQVLSGTSVTTAVPNQVSLLAIVKDKRKWAEMYVELQKANTGSIRIKFCILIKYNTRTSNCYFLINWMIIPCKFINLLHYWKCFPWVHLSVSHVLNSYSGIQHSHLWSSNKILLTILITK